MTESFVILGDGIAGSSAAETLREEAPDADITVVTDEGEALYNRILIKEFAKGKLPEAPISIHEPEWYEERDIELSLNTHVTSVDTDAHEVHTYDSGVLEYDKLLVATGGTPKQLPVANGEADGIHHFWTFQDARSIKSHAESCDTGTVVGAGLLGIDLAAICAAQGLDAHYLMRGYWWRYALSREGADIIHDALDERNVTPVFDSGVDRFEVDDGGHVEATIDPAGNRYDSDFVGVAIGLDFNTELLQNTPVGTDDGVVVDEYMQTNVEDLYAAGDITTFHDVILGEQAQNGSWGSAKEQGATAAKNMAADDEVEQFRWVSSYSITHFDFPFLSFGHPERAEEYLERKYGDQDWRRLALKDGKIIGGVLIGNLAPQTKYKQLIREEREVADQAEVLLEHEVDLDKLDAPATAE
jgi:NAD(P)H-nitrite reductase large subunit